MHEAIAHWCKRHPTICIRWDTVERPRCGDQRFEHDAAVESRLARRVVFFWRRSTAAALVASSRRGRSVLYIIRQTGKAEPSRHQIGGILLNDGLALDSWRVNDSTPFGMFNADFAAAAFRLEGQCRGRPRALPAATRRWARSKVVLRRVLVVVQPLGCFEGPRASLA